MAKIKLRRDTYQNWYDINPVLALGEPSYDTTNKAFKLGDGTTTWRDLSYTTGIDATKLPLLGGTLTGGLTGTNAVFNSVSATKFYGDASSLVGLPATYTPPADATFTSSVSAPAVRGMFYGDGSNLTGLPSDSNVGGLYLPLSGGTLSGPIYFNTYSYESGPRIDQGRFDTSRGGLSGISLVCSIDYDFNWQAGWITAYEQDRVTPRPLYVDSGAGTSIRSWSNSGSGVEITHEGIVFPNGSTLSAAPIFTKEQSTIAKTGGLDVETATELDLTKSVNKLADGVYTLANGVEGQIMYLVQESGGTNTARVYVSTSRINGGMYTNNFIDPFASMNDIVILLYTSSAWQALGGVWN